MPKRPRERAGEALKVCTLDEKDIGPIQPHLESFLYPVTREDFFASIYQKQALAVKVSPKLRSQRLELLHSLMDGFHPVKMLESSNSNESGGISVWMKGTSGGEPVMNSIKVGPAEAKKCYESGHSLYFRGSEQLESNMLNEFAKSVGFNFGALFRDGLRRSEIEVFAAHVGHKTDWHFDFQENFTVQLRGSKKWYLRSASVEHPHRACAMHFTDDGNTQVLHNQHQVHRLDNPGFCGLPANIEEECETVVLQPGDVLYHPAGVWHKVEAVEGPEQSNSLSINMSFFPMTWADLVTEGVQHAMMAHGHWRERVRFDSAPQARALLADRLKKLQSEVGLLKPSDIIPDSICTASAAGSTTGTLRYVAVGDEGLVVASNSDEWKKAALPKGESEYRRNPLGVLSKTEGFFAPAVKYVISAEERAQQEEEEEEEEEDDEDDNGAKTVEVPCPEGYVRFDYHSNFTAEDGLTGAPAVHVTFFVHADTAEQLAEAAQMSPVMKMRLPNVSDDIKKVLVHVGYITAATA